MNRHYYTYDSWDEDCYLTNTEIRTMESAGSSPPQVLEPDPLSKWEIAKLVFAIGLIGGGLVAIFVV